MAGLIFRFCIYLFCSIKNAQIKKLLLFKIAFKFKFSNSISKSIEFLIEHTGCTNGECTHLPLARTTLFNFYQGTSLNS